MSKDVSAPKSPLRVRARRLVLEAHQLAGLAAMLAMLFFAATGLMLNNAESWGLGEPRTDVREERMPPSVVPAAAGGDAAVVALLRSDLGVSGVPETPEIRDGKPVLVFKSPGRTQEVTLDAVRGVVTIETERRGLAGALMAMHKGESVGKSWRRLMDVAALGLILLTLTGFYLWAVTPRRQGLGRLALGLSSAVFVAIGWMCL